MQIIVTSSQWLLIRQRRDVLARGVLAATQLLGFLNPGTLRIFSQGLFFLCPGGDRCPNAGFPGDAYQWRSISALEIPTWHKNPHVQLDNPTQNQTARSKMATLLD